jgi:hypothetical protein
MESGLRLSDVTISHKVQYVPVSPPVCFRSHLPFRLSLRNARTIDWERQSFGKTIKIGATGLYSSQKHLKLKSGTLGLLVTTQFKVLASLQGNLLFVPTTLAIQNTQNTYLQTVHSKRNTTFLVVFAFL